MANSVTIPEGLSFEQAIEVTQALMAQMQQGELSEAEIEQAIATLVSSENGARGFFVTYLTDERPLADNPSASVIRALESSPEIVSDLLVKNLAMSSATAITHRRNKNQDMAQGSERVRSRTAQLMRLTNIPLIDEKTHQLLDSVRHNTGTYQEFLSRWGYDAEQRLVIEAAFTSIHGNMSEG